MIDLEFCKAVETALIELHADKPRYNNNGFDPSDFSTYPVTPINETLRGAFINIRRDFHLITERNMTVKECVAGMSKELKLLIKEGFGDTGAVVVMSKHMYVNIEPSHKASDVIFKKTVGDMSLCLGFMCINNGSVAIAQLGENVAQQESVDYMIRLVCENMPNISPPRLFNDTFVNSSPEEKRKMLDDDRYDPWAPDCHFRKGMQRYVLAGFRESVGSLSIFYPRLLKRIKTLLGENFYILPKKKSCSYIYPVSRITLSKAKELALGGSQWKGKGDDFLSSSVYKYNPVQDTIVRA
ncbi:MAG: hypothetical protein LBC41_09030 [Clostridiales bacterium]|nr:hypothetical protein [Clostridiales bacterium]MDR2750790.1 hypothetical protein [Clostridiales bacterium]